MGYFGRFPTMIYTLLYITHLISYWSITVVFFRGPGSDPNLRHPGLASASRVLSPLAIIGYFGILVAHAVFPIYLDVGA